MTKQLIEKADPRTRRRLLETLVLAARIRERREIMGLMPVATPAGEKRRTIFDGKQSTSLPGTLVRGEGDPPTADTSVNEAFDGLGETYDFYHQEFGRNSIDDKGMRLDATVHHGVDFDNAFWDGRQMVFGDGDGVIFVGFTKSLDVIAHELTHGVTQSESALEYLGQSGALNESFSDVFGSLVKQRALGQAAADADWLIGEGILGPNIHGKALRSMKEPGTAYDDPQLGKDPQPGHMKGYVQTDEDNGGVHINSGIPNHAFYLLAVALGGSAWNDAGQIWYLTLRRVQANSQFQATADVSFQAAGELFGTGSGQQQAVRNAWNEVGVRLSGAVAPRRSSRRASAEADASEYDKRLESLTEEVKDLKKAVDALGKKIDGGGRK